jgi:hypothetical protein
MNNNTGSLENSNILKNSYEVEKESEDQKTYSKNKMNYSIVDSIESGKRGRTNLNNSKKSPGKKSKQNSNNSSTSNSLKKFKNNLMNERLSSYIKKNKFDESLEFDPLVSIIIY